MDEFKGTPGPWFWESDVLCNVDFIVGGKHHQFNYRNRDLIAAAPELLEALQEALPWINNGLARGAHAKAVAAIKKALGQ
ncbi:hypothetical protein WKG86_05640 [Pantoea agglomerans]|uniref:hypothetical protein n=1 Tax=Enterobacter agglomerans TaxID=549 RepID=UPI003C7EC742